MTQPNITPQGFRTAAYLETKARMDAARSRSGKTRRQVTCTPPNVKCGGRCIPPNWDCRLKGKGPDSHLRAVRTDPISGLANIERGVKRISKGVRKGSFSEIEGGKRAIVRGVVKATPGDIQRKKKLQADLERRAGGIAAGLAVVGFGLFSHNQLKRASFYRDGVGRQIDDAVAAGINRVLDATPVIRRARAERRAAGSSAAGEVVARAAGESARGPEAMRGALLSTPTQLERRATEYGNAKVLENKIKALDIEAKELNMNASTWRQKNLETFWGATRTNAGGAGDGSTFSEPATNQYLSRQFGFKLKKGDDATAVRRSVATALNREAFNLQALARQEGVNLKDADSRNAFLNRVVGPGTANFSDEARARAVSNLDRIIGDAPRGRSTAVSRKQLADTFYRDTRDGFDRYFGRIADEVRQPAGAALSAESRKAGYSELLTSARIGQSRYLAKSLNKPEAVGTKMGQGLSDLVAKEYYSSKVIGSPTFTATDREIRLAASELSGRSFSTTAPAADYLRSNGFERLTTLRSSQTRVRSSTPSPEKPDRPARRRSNAQRIADLMRQKNKDGTPRYATREAAEAALKRMRKDELQQARIDAYLAVRADLRGKPCGASHIPKAHECRKTASGNSASKSKSSKSSSRGKKLALAAGAAAITGAAVVGGRAAFKNRQNIPLYKTSAKHINTGIQKMSSKKVRDTISKLPEKYQGPASKLLGKAKVGLAVVAADAQGLKLTKVDPTNNFSTFKNPQTGHVMSVGAVDDTLVTFVSTPSGKAGSFDKFGIAFQTDLSFDQKEGLSRAQGLGVAKQVKSMFKAQLNEMPENAVLFNNPYKDDGLGNKRNAIYRKFGFKELKGVRGGNMWALKNMGKLTEIPDEQADYVAKLIRGDSADTRVDLKCGKGAISKGEKCHVGPATKVNTGAPQTGKRTKRLALAAAAIGGTALAITAPKWTPAAQRIRNNAKPFDKNNPPQGATYLTEGVSGRTWISQDEKYVIKTPKGKVNKGAFANEVNTQNALHAAGISVPKIYNADPKKGVVIMDYLKNYNTVKSLTPKQQGIAVQSALREVEKMHRLGYSHGDLHMGNVLTKGNDIKLIDFGTAGPVTKNGISDINNLISAAKDTNAPLFTAMTNRRKALQTKISQGKALNQKDLLEFHEAVRKDLRRAS